MQTEDKIVLVVENVGVPIFQEEKLVTQFLDMRENLKLDMWSKLFRDLNALTKDGIVSLDYSPFSLWLKVKNDKIEGLIIDYFSNLEKAPQIGTFERNQSHSPEYNNTGFIGPSELVYNTFYFFLWTEYMALGEEKVGNKELFVGEKSEQNYYPDVMKKFRDAMKELFAKEKILRTKSPGFFTRFFNWIGSFFNSQRSLIYDFDGLVDGFLQSDPDKRISTLKLADALNNISTYYDASNSHQNSKSQKDSAENERPRSYSRDDNDLGMYGSNQTPNPLAMSSGYPNEEKFYNVIRPVYQKPEAMEEFTMESNPNLPIKTDVSGKIDLTNHIVL